MSFRECINCQHMTCTLYKKCYIEHLTLQAVRIAGTHQLAEELANTPDFQPAEDGPCTERFSHTGLCPCCGVEVDRRHEPGSGGGEVDECPACGWESDIFYDC